MNTEKVHKNRNVFRGFLKGNIKFQRVTALWVDEDSQTGIKKDLQLFYDVAVSVYMYGLYFPTELMVLFYIYKDYVGLIRCLRDIGNHISAIFKVFNWFKCRKHILNAIDSLENYDILYEDYQDFEPKQIVGEYKLETVKWCTIFWHFVNTIVISMLVSVLYVFTFKKQDGYVLENNITVYRQKLPINVISPFGSETGSDFLCTFFFMIVALLGYAWVIVALDTLFITLTHCISAHLMILGGAFKTIRGRCRLRLSMPMDKDGLYNDEKLQREMERELKRCIQHLQMIQGVAKKVEEIYNIQTCFQVLISLIEICFSLYLMSLAFDENTGNELTYLLSTGFQLLLYCWFGNRLTESSARLTYSLYECNWFAATRTFKKQMIFTMCRTNRHLHVTIGKITPLTLSTFLTIARGAYSFFTCLKQKASTK